MVGGIFGTKNNIYDQSRLLDKLGNYLKGKSLLEGNDDSVSQILLKNTKKMISRLSSNSDIKFPLPKINKFPLTENSAKSLYLWSYKSNLEIENKKNNTSTPIISEEDYLNDYNQINGLFMSEYMVAIKNNASIADKKKIFHNHYDDFIKKFNLKERLTDVYYARLFDEFYEANNGMQLKKEISATLNFYQELIDPDFTEKEMTNLYNPKCYKNAKDYSVFVDGIKNLVQLIKQPGFSAEMLFDEDGEFIKNKDILQLAIAPKCLNKENRTKLSYDFSCNHLSKSNYSKKDQLVNMRKDVVMSLVQGMPLGNTHPSSTSYHINTIVGFRFNPETKSCEYKIRESQTGSFYWRDEQKIIDKIMYLTVIERKK